MVDGAVGFASWPIWAVTIVGTAAFWVVIFLAVRALFVGRGVSGPPDLDDSRDPETLRERLDRGEITVEEYVHLHAQTDTGRRPAFVPTTPPLR
jgi:uncharacterized membrane protein